jgi:hypothetical protein
MACSFYLQAYLEIKNTTVKINKGRQIERIDKVKNTVKFVRSV